MINNGQLCYTHVPARVVFVFLTFLGISLVYVYKGFLSVAIVAMVKHKNTIETSGFECHTNESLSANTETKVEFDWNDQQNAIILGSFFVGYIITQIPAGVLSEKFGAKWIFGGSILIASILSLLGPVAARSGFKHFFLIRFGQGLAAGAAVPSMYAMIVRWMPKMERSRATSIILSGCAIGTVVSMALTGYLCDSSFLDGWPSVFYVYGITGCVWFALWALFVFENPDTHPYISQGEIEFINLGQGTEKTSNLTAIPWKCIFTSVPVYALILTHFGQNWGFLTILTLMPTYFKKILHIDIKTNGLISSLPYIAQAIISWIASYISDKIREKGKVSVTLIRNVNNTIAFFGPALFMIAIVFSKCNINLVILFFIIAMGLNGCCYPGFYSNYPDMTPNFAGTIVGISSAFSHISGFLSPLLSSYFYSEAQTLKNWSFVFYTTAGVYVITQIIFILFSKSELQTWNSCIKENPKKIDIRQRLVHNNKSSNYFTITRTLNSGQAKGALEPSDLYRN